MKTFLSFLFFCAVPSTMATDFTGLDVRSVSLGRTHALSESFVNPSYLSFQPQKSIATSVYNQFQIKELNTYTLEGILPNKYLDAGLLVSEFFYANYQQCLVRTGFSKKVTSRIAVGANLRFQKISMDNCEYTKPFISADLGLFFRLNKKIDLALLVENVVDNSSLDKCILYAGTTYTIISPCKLLLEFYSDFNTAPGVSAGTEIELADHFYFRMGLHSSPFAPTFGLSFSFDAFTVDLALDKHQILGFSSMLGVTYHL